MERLPVEQAITATVQQYKSISMEWDAVDLGSLKVRTYMYDLHLFLYILLLVSRLLKEICSNLRLMMQLLCISSFLAEMLS